MRTLFLLNPAAGKQDCTASLIPQIKASARRARLWQRFALGIIFFLHKFSLPLSQNV